MGPFYAERYPDLPVVTTIHGPFNDELTDLYRVLAPRVPIVCISHAQHRAAPDIPIARVIHHGLDAAAFPFGDGGGDEHGEFCLFLGRMAPDKGAHRAIEVARKAGMRVLLAAKMREQWERSYFDEQVAPLLGPDAVYLGEVPHEHKLELLVAGACPAVPDPVERALRDGHARVHGVRDAGAGLPRGGRARGGGGRQDRLPVRGRDGHGRRPGPGGRAVAGRLPCRGGGVLLDRAHGGGPHRALPRSSSDAEPRAADGPRPSVPAAT